MDTLLRRVGTGKPSLEGGGFWGASKSEEFWSEFERSEERIFFESTGAPTHRARDAALAPGQDLHRAYRNGVIIEGFAGRLFFSRDAEVPLSSLLRYDFLIGDGVNLPFAGVIGDGRSRLVFRSKWRFSFQSTGLPPPETILRALTEENFLITDNDRDVIRTARTGRDIVAKFAHRVHSSRALKMVLAAADVETLCAPDASWEPPEDDDLRLAIFPWRLVLRAPIAAIRMLGSMAKSHSSRAKLLFKYAHGVEDLPDGRFHAVCSTLDSDRRERLRQLCELYGEAKKLLYGTGDDYCERGRSKLVFPEDADAAQELADLGAFVEWEGGGVYQLSEVGNLERALAGAVVKISSEVREIGGFEVAGELSGIHRPDGTIQRLCDEQSDAIHKIASHGVTIVDGCAGSGKTAIVGVLPECLWVRETRDITYRGAGDRVERVSIRRRPRVLHAAFQGVNVGQLAKFGKSQTLHNLLIKHWRTHRRIDLHGGDKPCALSECDLLVIDEVGMVDLELLARVTCAFAACRRLKSSRLVLVGDPKQIPPINGEAPAWMLQSYLSGVGSYATFVHNHRVTSGGRLLVDNARNIVQGTFDKIRWVDDEFELVLPVRRMGETHKKHVDAAFDALKKVLERPAMRALKQEDYVVIVQRCKDAQRLSKRMERWMTNTPKMRKNDIHVGYKFKFTHNFEEAKVYTNEILVLDAVRVSWSDDASRSDTSRKRSREHHSTSSSVYGPITQRSGARIRLDFHTIVRPEERRNIFFEGEMRSGRVLAKASCVTVNSMQGSPARVVFFLEIPTKDGRVSNYLTRRKVYTACSRATERIYFISTEDHMHTAIEQNEPEIDEDFIADRLRRLSSPIGT